MSITNNFCSGGSSDKIEIGTITTFSDVKNRDGMILCDGSNILTSDYPSLEGKIELVGECFKLDNNIEYYFPKPLNNLYFAIRKNSDNTRDLMKSSDFKNWSVCYANCNISLASSLYGNMGVYAWGYYIFFRGNGSYIYSTNLSDWQTYSPSFGSYNPGVYHVAFGNNVILMSGNSGFYSVGTNITSWGGRKSLSGEYNIYFMDFVNGYFILGGWINSTYRTFKTTDGQTMTELYSSSRNSYPQDSYVRWVYNNKLYALRKETSDDGSHKLIEVDISSGSRTEKFETIVGGVSYLSITDAGIFAVGNVSTTAFSLYLTTDNFNTYQTFKGESISSATLENAFYAKGALYLHQGSQGYCYFDGVTKKLKLPTLNDTTNQLYGYIKT